MATRELEHLMQIAVILGVALMSYLAAGEAGRRADDRCTRHREEIDRLKEVVASRGETVETILHQLENWDPIVEPEEEPVWGWSDDNPPF